MKLKELLDGIDCNVLFTVQDDNVEVTGLTFDSRTVECGSVFFAVRGEHVDGHSFVEMAIEHGAVAVISDDFQIAMAEISKRFYGDPSSALNLVGVTGTNGKTTIVTLLYRLFLGLGYKVGLLSTVENRINERVVKSTHTTPDVIRINTLLREMVDEGCEFCFMEVSSHAVVQNRIAGLKFKGGVFTNLTHDHLDYHKTFAEYLKAKKCFFDRLNKDAFALTNIDDRNGDVMLQNSVAVRRGYALKSVADFKCSRLEIGFEGTLLNIDGVEVWTRLVGEFNAYNILAIYATAILLKQNKDEVLQVISTLPAAEGRFDIIRLSDGKNAIVDYAHTPDALINVLDTINEINEGKSKVITVVGAGGDRDRSKRTEMAQAAVDRSDVLILTSDNPRTESPSSILDDMQVGLKTRGRKLLVIENRREAIRVAVMLAQSGDIILVAGKGHEKYQEINGIRSHFDDKEELLLTNV